LENIPPESPLAAIFIWVLLHSGHDEAVYLFTKKEPYFLNFIDLSRYDMSIPERDTLKPKSYERNPTNSPSYDMEKIPRGFCLLINNYFTLGTYNEMQRFRNIFSQLHFKVLMEKNLDRRDIFNLLRRISQNDELKNHDAFVLMIITHGDQNGLIYGFDGQPIRINTITDMFNNDECPFFQGKPRIFFFNCCRGRKK